MKTFPITAAHRHLSKLLDSVEQGEEVVITRRGKAVARLSPMAQNAAVLDPVDWSESIRRRNESLYDLPQVQRNAVLEMREDANIAFVVPDVGGLREELGTYGVKGNGENEVLRQRGGE